MKLLLSRSNDMCVSLPVFFSIDPVKSNKIRLFVPETSSYCKTVTFHSFQTNAKNSQNDTGFLEHFLTRFHHELKTFPL